MREAQNYLQGRRTIDSLSETSARFSQKFQTKNLWQRGYSNGDNALDPVMALSEDSVVLAATTRQDVWVLKVDLEGRIGSNCEIEYTPEVRAYDWVLTAVETGATAVEEPLRPGGPAIEAFTADVVMTEQQCYAADEASDEASDEAPDETSDEAIALFPGNLMDEAADEQTDRTPTFPDATPGVPWPQRVRQSRSGHR